MTLLEIKRLIELGILTPDCDPNFATRKRSPELKSEVRRWVREDMSGPLLTKILEPPKTAH
jgi:hypothetical protein